MLLAANLAAVVGLWWRQDGIGDAADLAGLLTSLGRVTGLLGALLALVQLLLLARVPVLDGLGVDRTNRWHRWNGIVCLGLVVAHTVLITAGYAVADGARVTSEAGALLSDYSGVLLATIGLGLLIAVVVSSAVAVRRRLSHRAWHAIHVTAYAAIALAFSHQLATGNEFQQQPVARAYWLALYGVTLAALIWFRIKPARRRGARAADRQRATRPMTGRAVARRALPAAIATAAVVALLANVKPKLPDAPAPRVVTKAPEVRRVSSRPPSRPGPTRTATGQTVTTPFSVVAVRVTLTGGELTRVETIALSSADARTKAINARAEPILREEALRAGSADIDIVSGATYTSESYIDSLQSAIDTARRG